LPELAARLAAQIDDPMTVPSARLVHGRALARIGPLEEATALLRALALDWLGPAIVGAANQLLTRSQLLEALAEVPPLAELRAQIASAASPAIAFAEG
jgi:hypothetical protein